MKGVRILRVLADMSLSRQFLVTSLPVVVLVVVVIGTLVAREVKNGVVNRVGGVTGLYVESFVAPHAQTLLAADDLTDQDRHELGKLLDNTPLGERIVAFKVWRPDGRILYSRSPEMVGRKFPIEDGLRTALEGSVQSKISPLDSDENEVEAGRWKQLIETYVPIRGNGTGKVIAVAEFYQQTDEVEHEARVAQRNSWGGVAGTVLAMYLSLFWLVHRGSRTIDRQREELRNKVTQLSALVRQNEALHDCVRRAAFRSTTVNERQLRQISSDLHDGPGQDMSLALMQIESLLHDHVGARHVHPTAVTAPVASVAATTPTASATMESVRASLKSALADLRAICGGLRLPDIEPLTLAEVTNRAVRDYERKSGATVIQDIGIAQEQGPLPVKIALYRLLQESLSNGLRHAGGTGQRVEIRTENDNLIIRVTDTGCGFDPAVAALKGGQGLVGMRERAELLGGAFQVISSPRQGTVIHVSLPLNTPEMQDG